MTELEKVPDKLLFKKLEQCENKLHSIEKEIVRRSLL